MKIKINISRETKLDSKMFFKKVNVHNSANMHLLWQLMEIWGGTPLSLDGTTAWWTFGVDWVYRQIELIVKYPIGVFFCQRWMCTCHIWFITGVWIWGKLFPKNKCGGGGVQTLEVLNKCIQKEAEGLLIILEVL